MRTRQGDDSRLYLLVEILRRLGSLGRLAHKRKDHRILVLHAMRHLRHEGFDAFFLLLVVGYVLADAEGGHTLADDTGGEDMQPARLAVGRDDAILLLRNDIVLAGTRHRLVEIGAIVRMHPGYELLHRRKVVLGPETQHGSRRTVP